MIIVSAILIPFLIDEYHQTLRIPCTAHMYVLPTNVRLNTDLHYFADEMHQAARPPLLIIIIIINKRRLPLVLISVEIFDIGARDKKFLGGQISVK